MDVSATEVALTVMVMSLGGVWACGAVVVATNGDNTNVVCAQIAQKRFGVSCVVVRILDPARAALYAELGMRTVCPTSGAIDVLSETVLSHTAAI